LCIYRTGSPLIQPGRVGPCTAIVGGGLFFLVDCGPASFRVIRFLGLPVGRLSGIIFTHYHSDHIGDLGEIMTFSWIGGNSKLAVYGPIGVREVVNGFNEAYSLDKGYRIAHHGADILPPENHGYVIHVIPPVPEGRDNIILFRDKASTFTIKGFEVNHYPVKPAYGYRFEFNGRAVVVSGDTCKCDSLIKNAFKCDLLIQEAICCEVIGKMAKVFKSRGHPNTKRQAKFLDDILDYHTPVQDGFDVAAAADVKEMVFSHLVPTPQNMLLENIFFLYSRKPTSWKGTATIGADGMIFTVRENHTIQMVSSALVKRPNPYRLAGQIGTVLAGFLYYIARSNPNAKNVSIFAGAAALLTWFRSQPDFVSRM
jgi:ribonuclease Z